MQTSTTTQGSPLGDFCKENDSMRLLSKVTQLSQDLKEKELKLSSVQRELSSMESYREQCVNLKAQIMLYIEKINHYETELLVKNKRLSEFERNTAPKLSSYEYRLTESRRNTESLEAELDTVKADLNRRTVELDNLQGLVKNLDSQLKEALERKRADNERFSEDLEQMQIWKTTAIGEQDRLVRMLSEKEAVLEDIDTDNEQLRAELVKALDSLKLCQTELVNIPRLQSDLSRLSNLNAVKCT
jgi:chromosome segregation ATPase